MFQSILHFPIWQGAGAPHGYQRGAGVLRHVASAYSTRIADVPVDNADFSSPVGKVKAVETLHRHFAKAKEVLDGLPHPVLTVGGDCVADFMSITAALERHGDRMALLWVDAHPDINTPATSPSGNFHGMLVRTLLGEGPEGFTALVPHKLKPSQLFYLGIRDADMDEEEFRYIAAEGVFRLSVEAMEKHQLEPLFEELKKRGFTHVYLHVDSDVMSLEDYPQAVVAVPGGVTVPALIATLQQIRAHYPLAGGALTEYSLEFTAGPEEEALGRKLLVDGFGVG